MYTTETIELYLLGKLSEADKQTFEQELANNPVLQQEVASYQQIIECVKYNDFVKEMGKAHQTYINTKGKGGWSSSLMTWGSIALLSVLLGVAGYQYQKHQSNEGDKQITETPTEIVEASSSKLETSNDSTSLSHTVALKKISEVMVIADSATVDTSVHADNSEAIIDEIAELEPYKRQHKKAQKFMIVPDREVTIETKNGVKIKIPKNAFVGNPKEVQLEVEEYLELPDMILADLTTLTDDGKQLETGGMIHAKATNPVTGKELTLQKNIEISFPKDGNNNNGFLPFIGQKNNEEEIEWVLEDIEEDDLFEESIVALPLEEVKKTILTKDIYQVNELGVVPTYDRGALGRYLKNGLGNVKENVRVDVSFVLDEKGLPVDLKIKKTGEFSKAKIRTKGSSLTRTEKKILKLMEDMSVIWSPGQLDGDYVKTYINLPIDISPEGVFLRNLVGGSVVSPNSKKFKGKYIPKQQQKKEIEAQLTEGKTFTEQGADYYVFTLSSLGWINCDRFLNTNGKKYTFSVKNDENARLRLVFKNYKSILPANRGKQFQNVLENQEVSLIGIYKEGDVFKVAKTEFKTNQGFIPQLNYRAVDQQGLIQFANDLE